MLKIVASTNQHAEGLAALFSAAGSPCFCRWWHFEGDKNAWLDRCANGTQQNEQEMRLSLRAGDHEMRGAVALGPSDDVVGFMKLAPADAVPKLYAQRLYKGLPVLDTDRAGVYAVGCFLVHPEWRGRRVAHALLAGGLELAKSWGARAVEAFPRRAEGVSGEELWTGPFSLFVSQGFAVVHDFAPYPVLRCELR